MVIISTNKGVRNYRARQSGPYPGSVNIAWVNNDEAVGYITFIKFKCVTSTVVADRYVYVEIEVGSDTTNSMRVRVDSEFPQPASTTYTYFIALGYESKKIGNSVYLSLPRIYAERVTSVTYEVVNKQSGDQVRDFEFMTTTII